MATGIFISSSIPSCCRSCLYYYAHAPITATGPSLVPSATRPRILHSSFLAAAVRRPCYTHSFASGSGVSLFSDLCTSDIADRRRRCRHQQQRSVAVIPVRAARMESRRALLAFRAPEFELLEPLTGKTWKLDDFEDQQGLLVMFICNHCPFVVHLKENLASFAKEYQVKGLGVVAISSNSVESHPQDGPKYMAEDATKYGYSFPYLYDETQEVAKAYGAVCTPDFFLFKKEGRKPFELVYHGRFDETRPRSNTPITGRDMRAAANAILSGQPVTSDQKPSIGCSIKWHPGK